MKNISNPSKIQIPTWCVLPILLLAVVMTGCPADEDNNNTKPPEDKKITVPETYTFKSRFEEDKSSVAYSGQVARQVLIADLNTYIGSGLEMDALTNSNFTSKDDFVGALTYYYEFDGDSNGGEAFGLSTTPSPVQKSYDEISTGKDLKGKLAGNDAVTDFRDWGTEFAGWSDAQIADNGGSINSPEGLLTAFMSTLAAQSYDLSQGNQAKDPINDMPLPVYVTPQGHDLKQLIQKTLLMSIAFSQGTDDYLDSDIDGKGLKASNARVEGKTYTALEHAWDEAFGYFGAAQNYASYTDEELAGKGGREAWKVGYNDTNGDGAIDLNTEYNFAFSINAGKRDLGSGGVTNYTAEVFQAFLNGRTIIANAGETLTAEEMTALEIQRDLVVQGWEKVIAATVVHYINDTIKDSIKGRDNNAYDFAHHAKVWSEMKAFALGLQFNPRSPLLEGTRFADVHKAMGDAPVLPNAGEEAINAYIAELIKARDIFQQAYGFDASLMGDDKGEGGW